MQPDLLFASDANYLKRDPASGTSSIAVPASTSTTNITHSLGFIPFYEVHADLDSNGRIWNRNKLWQGMAENAAIVPTDVQFRTWMGTTQLSIYVTGNSNSGNRTFYYPLYRDYEDDAETFLFNSDYKSDKIVAQGEFSRTVNGPASGTALGYNNDRIETETITNPYGKRCLIRHVWSVDGTNYNEAKTDMFYSFTVTAGGSSAVLPGIRGAVAGSADDSNIYFQIINGYHGNATWTGSDWSFTGTNQTFYVRWAAFEVDV